MTTKMELMIMRIQVCLVGAQLKTNPTTETTAHFAKPNYFLFSQKEIVQSLENVETDGAKFLIDRWTRPEVS